MKKKLYTYDAIMNARNMYNAQGGRFYHTAERDGQDVYVGIAQGYKTMVARYVGWDNDYSNALYRVRFYNSTPARYDYRGEILTARPAGAPTPADRIIEA